MNKKLEDAINKTFNKLKAMSKEELKKHLDEHGNGDIAKILIESGALEVRKNGGANGFD